MIVLRTSVRQILSLTIERRQSGQSIEVQRRNGLLFFLHILEFLYNHTLAVFIGLLFNLGLLVDLLFILRLLRDALVTGKKMVIKV